ncbi:MAG: TolC family protein [Candidatus Eisenbacteria bacterium]
MSAPFDAMPEEIHRVRTCFGLHTPWQARKRAVVGTVCIVLGTAALLLGVADAMTGANAADGTNAPSGANAASGTHVASTAGSTSLDTPGTIVAVGGAGTPGLTMDDCIRIAREQNPALAGERFRAGEVKGLAYQTVSEAMPTLDLVGTWNRSRDPSFALDSTFGGSGDASGSDSIYSSFIPAPEDIPAQTFWRASLNANWELNPGRIYNAVRGVGLQLKQQQTVIEDTEHAVVLEVLRAYDGVRVAGEELSALEAEIAARREFLSISRRRFQLELATTLDTLQAAVSLANLEPDRRSAETRLRDAGASLNTLLGREPYEPIAVEAREMIDASVPNVESMNERIDQRLDIVERQREIEILRKTRGARKSRGRPYFNLAGSYGYVGRELDTIADKGHDFWSASVSLTVPIFSGLSVHGQVHETEAAIRRAETELADAKRKALAEVDRIYGELLAAEANRKAAELNLAQSELLVNQITHRYEVGKSEYLEVLNAQSERFRARTQAIQARSELFLRGAELKRALGFDPSIPFGQLPGLGRGDAQ